MMERGCDALIDQNKRVEENGNTIGLGHVCYNVATHTDGNYYLCDSCLEKWGTSSNLYDQFGYVTLPPVSIPQSKWMGSLNDMIEKYLEESAWQHEGLKIWSDYLKKKSIIS